MKIKNHLLYQDDDKQVKFRLTPNIGGSLAKPTVIIMHDTAGRLDPITSVDWLTNKAAKASAHLVVGRNPGEIWQLAPFNRQTWHAGKSIYKGRSGVNLFGIGIEFVNPGALNSGGRAWFGQSFNIKEYGIERAKTEYHGDAWWMPYTPFQISFAVEISNLLMAEYKTIADISAHYIIAPKRKVDVNPLFPLDYVRSRALGRADNTPDCTVRAGATIRKYPSFYKANVISSLSGLTKGEILDSGIYEYAGDTIVTGASPALWFKVKTGKIVGWVPAQFVETN